MLRLLDDQDWEKIDGGFTEGRRRRRIINARYKIEPKRCLKCGKTRGLGVHGRKTSEYLDDAEEERFVIRVLRLRYRCRKCEKTFFQPIPGLSKNRRMTAEFADALAFEAGRDTYSAVAGRYGVDDKTVARATVQKYPLRGGSRRIFGPSGGLGIHVIKVDGRDRAVFVDLSQLIIIDVIPSVLPKVIEGWLGRLKPREKRALFSVCLDSRLDIASRDAVRAALGKQVLLIAAKPVFNELADAAALAVSARGDQQSTRRAQDAKARFLEIQKSGSSEEGLMALQTWQLSIGAGVKRAFGPLCRALRDWESEFCSNFDQRAAFATMHLDHIHSELKTLERRQHGTGFETFFQKIFSPRTGETGRALLNEESPIIRAPTGFLGCEACRQTFGRSKVRGKFTLEGGFLAWMKFREIDGGCLNCRWHQYTDEFSARQILAKPIRKQTVASTANRAATRS
ncbi:hypothetical protein E0H22_15290 [Rhodopseudomonas boonkerdii]|uniref:hypothetical protein n=1 Tax=Rhodopseudomonas boonkerdii TaxID=475937 RepID=UPI001E569E2C|nr:hypothetical protein [Rhodopseudomonas boonkerdii]UGV26930.1 hypothetical protein E0H22_15290 [Rhodopseudomonas boonkerdii]